MKAERAKGACSIQAVWAKGSCLVQVVGAMEVCSVEIPAAAVGCSQPTASSVDQIECYWRKAHQKEQS